MRGFIVGRSAGLLLLLLLLLLLNFLLSRLLRIFLRRQQPIHWTCCAAFCVAESEYRSEECGGPTTVGCIVGELTANEFNEGTKSSSPHKKFKLNKRIFGLSHRADSDSLTSRIARSSLASTLSPFALGILLVVGTWVSDPSECCFHHQALCLACLCVCVRMCHVCEAKTTAVSGCALPGPFGMHVLLARACRRVLLTMSADGFASEEHALSRSNVS